MTRSFCLLKTGSTVKVFSWERMRIRFPWFFRSFNKRVLFSIRFWSIAAFIRGFPHGWVQGNHGCVQPSFWQVLSFSDIVSFQRPFDDFFAYNLRSSWWRTISRDSEASKHCSNLWIIILLTFSYFKILAFSKPASKKLHISIILASIRRYLKRAKFFTIFNFNRYLSKLKM